jgi:hypothetical protein
MQEVVAMETVAMETIAMGVQLSNTWGDGWMDSDVMWVRM